MRHEMIEHPNLPMDGRHLPTYLSASRQRVRCPRERGVVLAVDPDLLCARIEYVLGGEIVLHLVQDLRHACQESLRSLLVLGEDTDLEEGFDLGEQEIDAAHVGPH